MADLLKSDSNAVKMDSSTAQCQKSAGTQTRNYLYFTKSADEFLSRFQCSIFVFYTELLQNNKGASVNLEHLVGNDSECDMTLHETCAGNGRP